MAFVAVLDAVTSTGESAAVDLLDLHRSTTFVTSVHGYSSVNHGFYSLTLYASLDSVNWFNLVNVNEQTVNTDPYVAVGGSSLLIRYLQANLTELVGGVSPSVTLTVAAVG